MYVKSYVTVCSPPLVAQPHRSCDVRVRVSAADFCMNRLISEATCRGVKPGSMRERNTLGAVVAQEVERAISTGRSSVRHVHVH